MAALLHSLEITLQFLVPTACQEPNKFEHHGNAGERQGNVQIGVSAHAHSNLKHSLDLSGDVCNGPKSRRLVGQLLRIIGTFGKDASECRSREQFALDTRLNSP